LIISSIKGYEATSMADLLKAMELSKSSLYASFGGKYELFVAAFDTYRAEREREAKLILSQGTAREAIANLYQKIVRDARAGDSSQGCEYQSGCGNGAPRP
jgi:TetR/AcrR family transcriptional regulator, transcriptional repressor for nem operon